MVLQDFAYSYDNANWLSTARPTTAARPRDLPLRRADGQLTGVSGPGARHLQLRRHAGNPEQRGRHRRHRQAGSPFDGTSSYTYDAEGNRLTKVDGATDITTYSYDNQNHLTGVVETGGRHMTGAGAPYVYDVNGNRIEEGDYQGWHVTAVTLAFELRRRQRLGRPQRLQLAGDRVRASRERHWMRLGAARSKAACRARWPGTSTPNRQGSVAGVDRRHRGRAGHAELQAPTGW